MSETQVFYEVLQNRDKPDTLDAEHVPATLPDLVSLERQLISMLNWVRRLRNKKPVIVPKG